MGRTLVVYHRVMPLRSIPLSFMNIIQAPIFWVLLSAMNMPCLWYVDDTSLGTSRNISHETFMKFKLSGEWFDNHLSKFEEKLLSSDVASYCSDETPISCFLQSLNQQPPAGKSYLYGFHGGPQFISDVSCRPMNT